LPDALWFDLLRTHTLLALTRQPESFRQQVEARPRGSWVVVDEVPRLPSLLNKEGRIHRINAGNPQCPAHQQAPKYLKLRSG
jgi:hypothetical protein